MQNENNKNETLKESKTSPWLDWAVKLQAIAQAGLTYGKDVYDRERYEQIRDIAAEMISLHSGISKEKVVDLFCSETGYQTPKLDTRAAVFQDGKILLVKENNGTWSLPGGWVDVDVSVHDNIIKEVKEESGLDVTVDTVIAIQDREKHNQPVYAWKVCKVFALCSVVGGSFEENIETSESRYFSEEETSKLKLAEEKNVKLVLPVDSHIANEFSNDADNKFIDITEGVPAGWEILDIGPKTQEMFEKELKDAKTIVWNGPLGVNEFDNYRIGTEKIAKAIANSSAKCIIGGGDSAAAVKKIQKQANTTFENIYISTGGGASLEFLEGKELPGIACLNNK